MSLLQMFQNSVAQHVDPFSHDLHLFGFECNHESAFLHCTCTDHCYKTFQNFLGTWIG